KLHRAIAPDGGANAGDTRDSAHEVVATDQEHRPEFEPISESPAPGNVTECFASIETEVVEEPAYAMAETVIDPAIDTEHDCGTEYDFELEPAIVPPAMPADDQLMFELESQTAAIARDPLEPERQSAEE